MWHVFRRQKMTTKITTFTTHFTTHLPSKNHVLHTVFCKTPCKNALSPQIKKTGKDDFQIRQIQLVEGVDSVGVAGGSEAGDASAVAAGVADASASDACAMRARFKCCSIVTRA